MQRDVEAEHQWPPERAWDWHRERPWILGCNFIPSTIVNWTEMWQEETFDPETIDRELGIAAGIGFNSVRVFFQYLVWEDNPQGFKKRFEQFLELAGRHGISIMPVLFDDCVIGKHGPEPFLGKQPAPLPGMMFSSWTPSPGHSKVTDHAAWPKLESYVKDVIEHFGRDGRVLVWDLYNEPGNSGMGEKSLPLVEAAFAWARSVNPAQPLTVAGWRGLDVEEDEAVMALSDVTTFHSYANLETLEQQLPQAKSFGRPVICTEWMARPTGSVVETHLPVFQREKIGAYNWGLVNGRSQTQFPWGSEEGAREPELWFHDLFRNGGIPYRQSEVDIIRRLVGMDDERTQHERPT